jgi:hypothetical protein
MPDEGLGAVIGKVQDGNGRDSDYFLVGSSKKMSIEANQIGRLYLGINDDYLPDNSGSYRISVSAKLISGIPYRSSRQQKKRVKTIEISAKQTWIDTGIDLERNIEVEITAEGQIKIGERSAQPDGIRGSRSDTSRYPMPDNGLGAVIGKVRYPNGRDSACFFVGSSKTMNVEADQIGRLYLGINDDYLPDNSGSYRVTVSW